MSSPAITGRQRGIFPVQAGIDTFLFDLNIHDVLFTSTTARHHGKYPGESPQRRLGYDARRHHSKRQQNGCEAVGQGCPGRRQPYSQYERQRNRRRAPQPPPPDHHGGLKTLAATSTAQPPAPQHQRQIGRHKPPAHPSPGVTSQRNRHSQSGRQPQIWPSGHRRPASWTPESGRFRWQPASTAPKPP